MVALTPRAPTGPFGFGDTPGAAAPMSAPALMVMPPAAPEVVALMPSPEAQMVAPA